MTTTIITCVLYVDKLFETNGFLVLRTMRRRSKMTCVFHSRMFVGVLMFYVGLSATSN